MECTFEKAKNKPSKHSSSWEKITDIILFYIEVWKSVKYLNGCVIYKVRNTEQFQICISLWNYNWFLSDINPVHISINVKCVVYKMDKYHFLTNYFVRFQVLAVVSMNMIAFWDTVPYSPVEIDWRFRGVYCLYHQGDDNTTRLHSAIYPRRLSSCSNYLVLGTCLKSWQKYWMWRGCTFIFKQCTYPIAIFLHFMYVLVMDCEGSVLVMTEKVLHLQSVPPHHTWRDLLVFGCLMCWSGRDSNYS
jgi:hypothetical protein